MKMTRYGVRNKEFTTKNGGRGVKTAKSDENGKMAVSVYVQGKGEKCQKVDF